MWPAGGIATLGSELEPIRLSSEPTRGVVRRILAGSNPGQDPQPDGGGTIGPFRKLMAAVALVAIAGCAPKSVLGPVPPDPSNVSAIRVTPIAPAEGAPYEVTEQAASIASSAAFSKRGWWEARGRALEPLYRLDFLEGTRVVATYWLGTNSHPPEFPCYSICSGWWVGASTASGTFDPTRYRGLTSATYFPLVSDLEGPL